MALRDQPYLPLYIQDFMTDEKLMECSASTTGVYIRLMCIMHKSEQYGTILLKQKFKQTTKQINNFASQLAKFMPYDFNCILSALSELVDEKVLNIEGDFLIQKRMVKDALISEKRAKAGKKGGEETQKSIPKNKKKFAKAKVEAKPEIEIDNEIATELFINKEESEIKKIFDRWLKYKKDRGESYKSDDSKNTALQKLIKFSNKDPVKAFEIIDSAIGNNYSGFFQLKTGSINQEPISKSEIAINSHKNYMEKRYGNGNH